MKVEVKVELIVGERSSVAADSRFGATDVEGENRKQFNWQGD